MEQRIKDLKARFEKELDGLKALLQIELQKKQRK